MTGKKTSSSKKPARRHIEDLSRSSQKLSEQEAKAVKGGGVENPTTIGSATGGAGAGKIKFKRMSVGFADNEQHNHNRFQGAEVAGSPAIYRALSDVGAGRGFGLPLAGSSLIRSRLVN